MTTLLQDILYGCRMLANKPGFTVAAVLSLALGIGANTTIFSVINATLLSALPFPDSDRLVILWSAPVNRPDARGSARGRDYFDWSERSQSFAAVGASYNLTVNLGADEDGAPAERVQRGGLTAPMWDVLAVKPLMGRVFTQEEDQIDNGAPVIVLSYPFWQQRFGGAEDVVGKTVSVDGEQVTIIGVMPQGFEFASNQVAFWGPLGMSTVQLNSAASFLLVAARLKDGVSLEQAQSEMAAVGAGLRQAFPDRNRDRGVRVQDMQSAFFQGLEEPLGVLQGAVAFVLLIACANVAGLLLARAAARRTEVAVRAALGAGRGRIVRQLLTESVLLAIAGGVCGLAFAWAGLRGILASLPQGALPDDDIAISGAVLGYTMAVSIVTGLVFGLVPALQASKVDLAVSLKESGRTGMDGSGRQRLRSALVAAQIALALVLLIGAGLMMNSFLKLRSNELGADPTNLLTFEHRFAQAEFMRPVSTFRGVGLWQMSPITGLTWERMQQRLEAVPGVLSAAGVNATPLNGASAGTQFTIQGRPAPEPGTNSNMGALYFAITPHYFGTMRIPVLRGRDFSNGDGPSAPLVAIINKALADQWWPGADPIGERIRLDFVPDEQPREIVGVVGNTLTSYFQQQPQPMIYVPHVQQTEMWQGPMWNARAMMVFVMRTAGDPVAAFPTVRSAAAEIDPSKPAGNMRTVEQYLGDQLGEPRVFLMLLGVFGSAAAVLAAIGIYGVMAYAVAQRTREIGIRVALGASGGNVVRLVVRQAFLLIAAGLVIGLGGAYALTRFLANFLWQVSPTDPSTFAIVSAGLLVVAAAACLIPTRRAVTVDPTIALRYE